MSKVEARVLVLDHRDEERERLRAVLGEHHLQGIVAETEDHLFDLLAANIELSAVFLSQDDRTLGSAAFSTLRNLHYQRAELPIFFRSSDTQKMPKLDQEAESLCAFVYRSNELEGLQAAIPRYIFSTFYPLTLIREFQSITMDAFSGLIGNIEVVAQSPYLIHDRIIYGQICSLIRLSSDWCNGYMMLQAPETELLQTVTSGRTPLLNSQISFRSGHDVLGELTNLIWGQIKATVLDAHDQGRRGLVAELPLIINENRKYLTFGATEPALCLSYKIREADTGDLLLEVHQKFLFTMTWRPEVYLENPAVLENLLAQGELTFL